MKCYLLIRSEMKPNINSKEPTFAEIYKTLVARVMEIWHKASLPVVTQKRVICILRAYHDKYRNLIKPYKSRKTNKSYKEKIQSFQKDSKKLFDICSCKCHDFANCKCKKSNRKNEVSFLTDQRNMRTMYIGSIDVITTLKEQRKEERKQKELSRLTSIKDFDTPSLFRSGTSIECSSPDSTESSLSPEVKRPKYDGHSLKQMRIALPSLALACDRSGVSDRSAALIASSVLKDVGMINTLDQSVVIDPSKIRRERAKIRSVLQRTTTKENVLGLYFDGRRDRTLVMKKKEKNIISNFKWKIIMF